MGGYALPPGSRGDAGVILAADGLGLGENIRVQGLAAAQKRVVFPGEAAQCVRNLRALPGIPGPAGDTKIIDGGDILIAQQRKGALRGGKPRFPGEFQPAFRGGNPARRGGQIQIAPVDSDVIARIGPAPAAASGPHRPCPGRRGRVSVGVHGRGHLALRSTGGRKRRIEAPFRGPRRPGFPGGNPPWKRGRKARPDHRAAAANKKETASRGQHLSITAWVWVGVDDESTVCMAG